MKTYRITIIGLLCALAMILSYLESLIPPIVPVPGIKMGLPNLIIVFALYKLGARPAFVLSLIRVFLVSLLFGSVLTLAYSTVGAVLSLLLMALFKKLGIFSEMGVSIIGGVSHNAAQITVACIIMETSQIAYYLPALIVSGVVTGAVIGIGGGLLIKKIDLKERF